MTQNLILGCVSPSLDTHTRKIHALSSLLFRESKSMVKLLLLIHVKQALVLISRVLPLRNVWYSEILSVKPFN